MAHVGLTWRHLEACAAMFCCSTQVCLRPRVTARCIASFIFVEQRSAESVRHVYACAAFGIKFDLISFKSTKFAPRRETTSGPSQENFALH